MEESCSMLFDSGCKVEQVCLPALSLPLASINIKWTSQLKKPDLKKPAAAEQSGCTLKHLLYIQTSYRERAVCKIVCMRGHTLTRRSDIFTSKWGGRSRYFKWAGRASIARIQRGSPGIAQNLFLVMALAWFWATTTITSFCCCVQFLNLTHKSL